MLQLQEQVNEFKLGKPGIVLIRGTNGTGKSTIIKNFLPDDAKLCHFEDLNCHYYDCGTHFIVGKYETDCGGLDGVRGNDTWKGYYAGQEAIRRLSETKTTLAEGILASSTFEGTYNTVKAAADRGHPTFWFSIDIPLELVFESVLRRRVAKGNVEPLVTDNVAAKYRTVPMTHNKAVEAGVWAFRGDRAQVLDGIRAVFAGQHHDLKIGETFNMDEIKKVKNEWEAKGQVAPTQAMIDELAPKPTTNSILGFFA